MNWNKQGKQNAGMIIFLGFVVVVGLMFAISKGYIGGTTESIVQQEALGDIAETITATAACPDNKSTSLNVNVLNTANGTASEEIGANAFLYRVINGERETNAFTTIADTEAGSATVNCGEPYMLRLRTTSAAAQAAGNGLNNTLILSASGIDDVDVQDGDVYFTASKQTETLNVKTTVHGVLEFQSFSNADNSFLNEAGNTDGTGYQASPADFEGTANGAQLAVGAGGELDLTINFRTQDVDKEYNNLGYYISVNASSTVWDTPTLTLDGEELSNVKGSLDQYCSRAYSNEEYVYFADRDVPVNSKGQLDFYMKALSGVNPANTTDDPSITWHAIGTYVSITGSNNLQVGACDDGSSTQNVYAAERVSIDIS